MEQIRWFYRKNGKTYGPVSRRELLLLVKQGKLKATDPVKREDGSNWMPAIKDPVLARPQSKRTGAAQTASPTDPSPSPSPPRTPVSVVADAKPAGPPNSPTAWALYGVACVLAIVQAFWTFTFSGENGLLLTGPTDAYSASLLNFFRVGVFGLIGLVLAAAYLKRYKHWLGWIPAVLLIFALLPAAGSTVIGVMQSYGHRHRSIEQEITVARYIYFGEHNSKPGLQGNSAFAVLRELFDRDGDTMDILGMLSAQDLTFARNRIAEARADRDFVNMQPDPNGHLKEFEDRYDEERAFLRLPESVFDECRQALQADLTDQEEQFKLLNAYLDNLDELVGVAHRDKEHIWRLEEHAARQEIARLDKQRAELVERLRRVERQRSARHNGVYAWFSEMMKQEKIQPLPAELGQ